MINLLRPIMNKNVLDYRQKNSWKALTLQTRNIFNQEIFEIFSINVWRKVHCIPGQLCSRSGVLVLTGGLWDQTQSVRQWWLLRGASGSSQSWTLLESSLTCPALGTGLKSPPAIYLFPSVITSPTLIPISITIKLGRGQKITKTPSEFCTE